MTDAPHIDAFNRRLGRPVDETPFAAWFRGICAYAQRNIDNDLRDTYERSLTAIPIDQLQSVWQEWIEKPDIKHRELPPIGQLRAIHRARKNLQASRARPDIPQVEYHSDKQKAWRFVQGKYQRHVTFGMLMNIPNPDYIGDFDWEYVVLSAKWPTDDSLTAHQAAWDAIRTDFEAEWGKAA